MEKELKAGDEIPIEKHYLEILKDYQDRINGLRFALDSIGESLLSNNKRLFEIIENFYPELKDWGVSFNSQKRCLTLLYKKIK